MTQIELSDVNYENLGHLNPGRVQVTEHHIAFKNSKTGKLETIPSTRFKTLQWTRLANKLALQVTDKDGVVHRYGNIDDSDREKLESFSKSKWDKEIIEDAVATKGWNYGGAIFDGATLKFQVDKKTAFAVPLANVSQATSGRHEAVLEFHQNDDCSIGLMEMRFHMTPNEQNEEEDDNETDRLQEFIENVLNYAGVVKDTDKPLAVLTEVMCNPPRGRYEIKMFPNHLSFHGKTFDYKVPVKSIMRLFLLPHKDGRHMFFVIGLDPPIRQGQTRYHYIVLEFNKDENVDVEIGATDEQLTEKYSGKLQKEMSGPKYEIVSRIMRALVNQRITVPGTFVGSGGQNALSCAYKQAAGYLYPLEKGFVYVSKPPMYIRYEEVSVVNFARSDVSTRSFDFEVELSNGTVHVFNSMEKDEYSRLFDFVSKKNLRIRNAKQSSKPANIIDDFIGSDDEDGGPRDHYKERLKKEAATVDDDESSETDEDFDPDAPSRSDASGSRSSTPTEEYDSEATGSDSGAGGGGDDDDDEGEKPKKKEKKEKKKKKARSPSGSPVKKKKRTKKEKDPNAPKRAMSAYFIWLQDNRPSIAKEGMSITDIAKAAGEKWKTLTDDEKKPYEERAAKDKQRYEREKAAYASGKSDKPSTSSDMPTKSASNVSPSKVKSKEYIEDSSDSDDDDDEKKKKKVSKDDEDEDDSD